jgi:hypothetical protein
MERACENGSHRNKSNNQCEVIDLTSPEPKTRKKRNVEDISQNKLPRCENGSRRNNKTRKCEKKLPQQHVIDLVTPPSSSTGSTTRNNSASPRSKKRAATKIQSLVIKSKYNKAKKTLRQQREKSKKQATTDLRRFFRKKSHIIRTKFLKSVCTDSGVCIAFGGKEGALIKEFFNGFRKFDFAVSKRKIGENSVNGFVYEITYQRENYMAHAVLKSSRKPNADNLSYEYFVGDIINNQFLKKYPCFVETYGLYQYTNENSYLTMGNDTNNENLDDFLHYFGSRMSTKRGCVNSQFLSILIQNIKNARTLKSMITVEAGRTAEDVRIFVENDLASCLYQIYYVLAATSNVFTHYDLHYKNVLLFEPVANKYIQYTYQNSDGGYRCTFKSKYIVKIIDYGRSFITDMATATNSMSVYDKVCAEPSCVTTCGNNVGYYWLNPAPNAHNLNSTRKNITKDLRLLELIRDIRHLCRPVLKRMLKKVRYNGGAENTARGYPYEINNVADAEKWLKEYLNAPDEVQQNNAYYETATQSKLGDLHIRADANMNYTPTPL